MIESTADTSGTVSAGSCEHSQCPSFLEVLDTMHFKAQRGEAQCCPCSHGH